MAKKYTYGGVEYNIDVKGTNANWNLTPAEKEKLMRAIILNNGPLTDQQLADLNLLVGDDINRKDFKNVKAAMELMVDNNAPELGFNSSGEPMGTEVQLDPKELAFNEYYRDIYSLEDVTGGREMLTNLENAYTRQYESQGVLADAQYQTQAMQQAAVVKQITDQIRNERMTRLKAGMNPAQIANQDMQMMMANVGALNQSALAASQQSLEAQLGINNAKDEAYMAYLDQANARGQNAAAMYAADSGNANKMTYDMMRAKYGDDPSKWNTFDLEKTNKTTIGQGN